MLPTADREGEFETRRYGLAITKSCQVRSYFITNRSDTGLSAAGYPFVSPFVLVMREISQSRMMSRIIISKNGPAIVKHVMERIGLHQRRATGEKHSQPYMQIAPLWKPYCSLQSCVCFAIRCKQGLFYHRTTRGYEHIERLFQIAL